MSLQNQHLVPSGGKSKRVKYSRDSAVDFCKIGGLGNHLKTLREIIIFPLLHGNVFAHFNIKAPRGVLFYGPPGTGKTLVAAALATEINREGIGKVAFFPRKGADILDKWVGGSEKNLRDLFEKATKSKPSIIFFDELDGLAPRREKQMDQIHSSVVATLLALMDGLDNKPGVIVIGATNRIEAIDPALRRPGRFDKELYFPLPGVGARRQILEVHTNCWKHRPNCRMISALVEATSGFSGADLQALCSEAILRCMKRTFPCLKATKIDPEKLRVEECDFLNARLCIVPSTQKNGMKMRKLTGIIQPLLDGQLRKITQSIRTFWPHFLQEDYKYMIGEERYAGRVLIIGSHMQGVDGHLIPAILQQLEYLPSIVYDVTYVLKKNAVINPQLHFPSVVLMSRVDEWWGIIDKCEQLSIVSALEDIHAGLPILVLATCRKDVPEMLQNFFYNNSSILLNIEDPSEAERKEFLSPLFMDRNIISLVTILENNPKELKRRGRKSSKLEYKPTLGCKRKAPSPCLTSKKKRQKLQINLARSNSASSLYDIHKGIKQEHMMVKKCDSLNSLTSSKSSRYFSTVLSSLLGEKSYDDRGISALKMFLCDKRLGGEQEKRIETPKVGDDAQMQRIDMLWEHTSLVTSRNMTVTQLELLYDVISACINIHWNSFECSMKHLEEILGNIERCSND